MYVAHTLRKKGLSQAVDSALLRHLDRAESPQAMYAATRIRGSVEALVVTDQRVITLGMKSRNYPLVDSVSLTQVTTVAVDQDSVFSWGRVRVGTENAVLTLGTVTSAQPGELERLERLLSAHLKQRRADGTVRMVGWTGPHVEDAPPKRQPVPEVPEPDVEAATSIVEQLRELAKLREAGLLTADEYERAKAAVLRHL